MTDVVEELHRAITTASNDDTSTKGSETRERHVERLNAMRLGLEEIDKLRAEIISLTGDRAHIVGFNRGWDAATEDRESAVTFKKIPLTPPSGGGPCAFNVSDDLLLIEVLKSKLVPLADGLSPNTGVGLFLEGDDDFVIMGFSPEGVE